MSVCMYVCVFVCVCVCVCVCACVYGPCHNTSIKGVPERLPMLSDNQESIAVSKNIIIMMNISA